MERRRASQLRRRISASELPRIYAIKVTRRSPAASKPACVIPSELGPVGEAYLTELVHQRPHIWKGDVERLFALLEELGDPHFRLVLQRALAHRLIGAEYVVRLCARLGPLDPVLSAGAVS